MDHRGGVVPKSISRVNPHYILKLKKKKLRTGHNMGKLFYTKKKYNLIFKFVILNCLF